MKNDQRLESPEDVQRYKQAFYAKHGFYPGEAPREPDDMKDCAREPPKTALEKLAKAADTYLKATGHVGGIEPQRRAFIAAINASICTCAVGIEGSTSYGTEFHGLTCPTRNEP